MSTMINPARLEDYLLAGLPLLTALVGFDWTQVGLTGASGFLVGVAIASLAKALLSLGQNPTWRSWDDVLLFVFTLFGILAAALSANPNYILYGTVLGFIAKASNVFQNGFNIEDALLFVGAFLAAYGQYFGHPALASIGLLIGTIGKALPSLGSAPAPAPATPSTPTPVPPA